MKPGIIAEEEQFEAEDAAGQAAELVARIQHQFGEGGAAAAIHAVRSGMTAEEMLAVAEGRGEIVDGGEENGLVFRMLEEGAPLAAKAKKQDKHEDEKKDKPAAAQRDYGGHTGDTQEHRKR